MKLKNFKASSTFEATIKESWLKTTQVSIPIKKIMYALSDPHNWDEIDSTPIDKNLMGEVSDVVLEMKSQNEQAICELLLKIAGKHHNAYENEMIAKFLNDREFAKQQSRMM
ncbi:MAG: hypothetical protein HUJ25_06655 [Crocinitomicaceae bacterium]|nr:hypothetical protein [Crocinitomicaceae bacterium]